MIRVKLSTHSPEWPFLRQTPGGRGLWGECRFFIDEEVEECDFWVVYDDLLKPEKTRCAPENTLLITAEPPTIRRYSRRFTDQFARVLTCHADIKHPHLLLSQQALPWMVGCRSVPGTGTWERSHSKDYDELISQPPVPKTKKLSVISSSKAFTPGHQQRVAFVRELQNYFGDAVDVFGRGFREIEDKWDAIAPYQYHIVLENSAYPDYWTEKLTDAFLADAYPFYYGCPNLEKYFDAGTHTPIDIYNFEAARQIIVSVMEQDRFTATVEARRQAKHTVMDTYQLFPLISHLAAEASADSPQKVISLLPDAVLNDTPLQKTKRLVKRLIGK